MIGLSRSALPCITDSTRTSSYVGKVPEADIATALSERQRSPGHHVDGGSSPDIVSIPSGQIRNLLVECTHRDGMSVPGFGRR
jgi:hypothetical protein